MADSVRYNQSQLMFGDLEIICGSFKTSFKIDSEDLNATNSKNAYDTTFGKETVEAEASDIDPTLRRELKKLYDAQVKQTLSSYDFDESTGDLIEDDVLYGAYIKEISKEDSIKPFSVKFGARSHKKQD
jgi:hypothetical protein